MDRFLSPYFAVAPLPGVPILRIVRSPRPFSSLADMSQAWYDLNQALDRMGRTAFALLLDVRLIAGRNDLEFEQVFAGHRSEMERGFRRVAVLVNSPAGWLQVERHAAQDGACTRAFLEAPKAIDWLCEADAPIKRGAHLVWHRPARKALSQAFASAPPPG